MENEIIRAEIAVIGAGPGGGIVAEKTAGKGLKTFLIDKGSLGGSCLNRGCVPSKSWLAAEHLYRQKEFAKKIGINLTAPDFSGIKAHHEEVVSVMQKGLNSTYQKMGITMLAGNAVFTSEKTLSINNGQTILEFENAVIATGSRPINPFGNGDGIYTSDTIFTIEKLPESIAIIGGGAIGMEMATFFSGVGTNVTVIEALEDILPTVDGEIRAVVKRELKKKGVTFLTATKASKVSRHRDSMRIDLENGETVNSEILLVAIGRIPESGSLGLENTEVSTDKDGYIITDQAMRTSQKGIYAIGDVAGKTNLAYIAHHEGIVAARDILGSRGLAIMDARPVRIDHFTLPIIIFTNPEVGFVGKTEEDLKREGNPYNRGVHFIRALARAHASGEIAGLVKILTDDSGRIVGIHMAGPGATEIVHTAAVAIKAEMTAEAMANTIFGHPTIAEAIPLAAASLLEAKK
ncbi:MAG: dihydrolipoyl dehydrogenase [Nitrospinota bacterium]|nr:dihydrolipoyl dehydrogenase [Nitrospinota bacterium]